MNLLERCDRLPPRVCRFVARKNHGTEPMSHADIALRAGLSRQYVAQLSVKTTWRGIPVDVVERFADACGVDLMRPRRTIEFLRRSKKNHLTGANATQRKFLQKILMSAH